MVEPSYGDSSIAGGCADFANLTHRDNVVFSVHGYFAGGDGFGSGCRQVGRYAWRGRSGYRPADAATLTAHLRSYLGVLRPQGIPLYIGEFGMADHAAERDAWIHDTVAVLDHLKLGRAWWEYHTSAEHRAFSATASNGGWLPFTKLLVGRRLAGGRRAGHAGAA